MEIRFGHDCHQHSHHILQVWRLVGVLYINAVQILGRFVKCIQVLLDLLFYLVLFCLDLRVLVSDYIIDAQRIGAELLKMKQRHG
jgi:hypothetical protein